MVTNGDSRILDIEGHSIVVLMYIANAVEMAFLHFVVVNRYLLEGQRNKSASLTLSATFLSLFLAKIGNNLTCNENCHIL